MGIAMRRTKRYRKKSSNQNFRKKLTKKQKGGYDIYKALNIPPESSAAVAKKAWRKYTNIYHTDKKPMGDAAKFNMITKAYTILRSPARKRLYDENFWQVAEEAFNMAMNDKEKSENITNDVGNWRGPEDDGFDDAANNQQQQQQQQQ